MTQLFFALFLLFIGYMSYRDAKRRGLWSWKKLFLILASIALFTIAFIIPISFSPWMVKHPILMFSVMMGGILIFVIWLAYAFRIKPGK